jgi:hypothetical protein
MDKKKLNTVYDFELEDGTVVTMTLRFYSLYQLKSKNKSVYDRYNKIMTKGPTEELENVTILYTAYLCANVEHIEDCISEIEFLQRMPTDREYISTILGGLINPKKN